MKIIFFGNWNLGYISLNKLLKNRVSVSLVVTDFDIDDNDVYRNSVYKLAYQYGIPVYKSYREILDCVDKGDVAFSVAYGHEIFKLDILDKIKIYNFHPSYLPHYKGPSPIQWQIKNKESRWGMTCHEVDSNIDTGKIVNRDNYVIDGGKIYRNALDEYNAYFANFIFNNIIDIIDKTKRKVAVAVTNNSNLEEDYKPRLSVPGDMWNDTIDEISNYFNRKRVLFFAGNRAELGIMFPVVLEMSKIYYVDLIVSDTYSLSGEEDLEEKKKFVKRNKYRVNFINISVNSKENTYFESLPCVYKKVFAYVRKQEQYPYKFAFVLGDRIESLGFALAVFYGKVPLVHMSGGDIAEVPYFDNSVRHCISKLANFHLPFSEESARTLRQMGEDEKRICVIGNPSFDYDRMELIAEKDGVDEEFHIGNGFCAVFTYHAGPLKTSLENLAEYKECLQGVMNSGIDRIIVTSPNNDPGSEAVLDYVDELSDTERMTVVRSLGTAKLLSIMKNFKTIIVGNSSMGLLETAYYICPALNIGDRQTDRIRGVNVRDVRAEKQDITDALNSMIKKYDDSKKQFEVDQMLFGDGNAAIRTVNFLKGYEKIPNEELVVKKFVRRM